MRIIIVACVFIASSLALYSQDSSSVATAPAQNPAPSSLPAWQPPQYGPKPVQLTANPTVQELAELFVEAGRGEVDPFDLIGKIAERKDEIVTTLNDVLISEVIEVPRQAIAGDTSTATQQTLMPNKVYAVWALKAIGSVSAYSTLFQAASSHKEIEVRGLSLHTLAFDYLQKAQAEALIPNREIVYVFLKNVDDKSNTLELNRTIADVSREALKNWTGIDFAEIIKARATQELWWVENHEKLSWNTDKGQFEIK